MKINEYLELQKTDNEVWRDINNYMRGLDMEKYVDIESLLLDLLPLIELWHLIFLKRLI